MDVWVVVARWAVELVGQWRAALQLHLGAWNRRARAPGAEVRLLLLHVMSQLRSGRGTFGTRMAMPHYFPGTRGARRVALERRGRPTRSGMDMGHPIIPQDVGGNSASQDVGENSARIWLRTWSWC